MNWQDILKDDTWVDPDPIKCTKCKTGNLITDPRTYIRASTTRNKSSGNLICDNPDCDYKQRADGTEV